MSKPHYTTVSAAARTSVTALALSLALAAVPAFAQDVSEEPVADEEPMAAGGDIVVTGSRIARDGFNAPTPVTALGSEQFQLRAPTTIGDALATIPSFRGGGNATSSGVNSRGGGVISADLRGLGPTRTLVLVDGRRFIGTGSGAGNDGVVDLKLIPTMLVQQVEVVTGGASAAWGSDAVAGVVNFILRDEMEGIEGTIQTGISSRGDNQEYRVALATGQSFADGKIHLVMGGDFVKNEGIGNQYTRDWGRLEYGLITNPNYATNGLPNFIISPNVRPASMTPGGLITTGPLRGLEILPNGQTRQFNFGTIFGANMIGGDNQGNHLSNTSILRAPMQSITGMAKLKWEVSPAFEPFVEANLGFSKVGGISQQPRDAGTLTIQRDNAYLPQSVRDLMVANNLQTITVGRLSNDSGGLELHGRNRLFRGVVGAKGDLGGSWRWDAYYQFGRNHYTVKAGPNNRIVANWRNAIDAVESNGAIVCRSTLTNPANGCKPINIFGDGSVVVNDYAFGTATFDVVNKQHVAAANLNGDIFETWAGPVSLAVGAEYRKETIDGDSDAISQALQANGTRGGFQLANQPPITGSYDLWEAYAEAVVPLLRDSPLGRSLDLNGAVRRTDYSISGVVTTWKAGLSYEPFDGLRFRATRSRDIRAPNLQELFSQPGGAGFTNIFDPVAGQTVQVREIQTGNLGLSPEKADTWTVGLVAQARSLGLSLSVDYYDIKVDDVISNISGNLTANRCFAGQTEFCQYVNFNPDGTINAVRLPFLNLNAFKTSGVDFELKYDTGLWGGDFSARALGTYVDKLVTVDATGTTDRVGKVTSFNRTSGVPHFMGSLDLTYKGDGWLLNALTRFVGQSKFDPALTEGAGAANTINKNSVPAYAYLSMTAQVDIDVGSGKEAQMFLTVDNLTDTRPPFVPSGSVGGAAETSTTPAFYDVIGRSFKIGLRFKL